MASAAVVGLLVIGGLIFGIPLLISIIRAICNFYFERRERRENLTAAAELGLNVFNFGNEGSILVYKTDM